MPYKTLGDAWRTLKALNALPASEEYNADWAERWERCRKEGLPRLAVRALAAGITACSVARLMRRRR